MFSILKITHKTLPDLFNFLPLRSFIRMIAYAKLSITVQYHVFFFLLTLIYFLLSPLAATHREKDKAVFSVQIQVPTARIVHCQGQII